MERSKYETMTSSIWLCFGEACARTCVGLDLPWYRSDVEHGEGVESSKFALHYHGRTSCYRHCLAHNTSASSSSAIRIHHYLELIITFYKSHLLPV